MELSQSSRRFPSVPGVRQLEEEPVGVPVEVLRHCGARLILGQLHPRD